MDYYGFGLTLNQACIRGKMDIDAATAAFTYYNLYTNEFPITIQWTPTSAGPWSVDMRVSRSPATVICG